MKLGIISDTHGFFDPQVPQIFAGVDHILHAGDVGPYTLLLELQAIAPVTAVLGNTDSLLDLRGTELVELDKRKFLIHHIVDPQALTPGLQERMARDRPDAVIFGHTHQQFCAHRQGTLFLNPGYAGRPRFGDERSVAILHATPTELNVKFFPLRRQGRI